MNWFLKLFGGRSIHVGTRVLTKKGFGTVVGGNIHVIMDEPFLTDNPNQRQWTFNIDKERITNA